MAHGGIDQLIGILTEQKGSIVEKWIQKIHETYPPETANFFRKERNKFANPVGSTIQEAAGPIVEELLEPRDSEVFYKHLDSLIRVRAVQDFTAYAALSIFFALKGAIRDIIGKQVRREGLEWALLEFESRVDRMALLAFDIFMQCREKVWEIKRDDLLKRPFVLSGGMCASYMVRRGQKHLKKAKGSNNPSLN